MIGKNLTDKLQPENGETKWLALSCSHAPLQDNETIDIICERIKEYKPDVIIHLGDLFEADSASKWGSEYSWTYEDELYEGCEMVLKKLREANTDAECWFLPGNHDENLREEGRFDRKIRDSLDWNAPQYTTSGIWLNEELKNWSIKTGYEDSRKGVTRIGAVSFCHGFRANRNADVYHAKKYAWENGLMVSGHLHRPTIGNPRNAGMNDTDISYKWYLNAGCTRQMDCNYMLRKNQHSWGHAVCYGYSKNITSSRTTHTWDAHCELIKMYE